MTITAEELAKLDKAATQGEWQWTILDHSMACLGVGDCPGHGTPLVMGVSPCRSCADRIEGENGEWTWGKCLTPSLADAAFIPAAINAYRSGQLVHVDEVESKMTLPDCPEVLWAQRHLGRDDWQVSENVTPASMGVSASEKFVNARELREAVGEVEKLRAALRECISHLVVSANNAHDASKTDERWNGVYEKIQEPIIAARAALGDNQ